MELERATSLIFILANPVRQTAASALSKNCSRLVDGIFIPVSICMAAISELERAATEPGNFGSRQCECSTSRKDKLVTHVFQQGEIRGRAHPAVREARTYT